MAPDPPSEDRAKTQLAFAAVIGPQPATVVIGHSLGAQTIPLDRGALPALLAGVLQVENASAVALAEGFWRDGGRRGTATIEAVGSGHGWDRGRCDQGCPDLLKR